MTEIIIGAANLTIMDKFCWWSKYDKTLFYTWLPKLSKFFFVDHYQMKDRLKFPNILYNVWKETVTIILLFTSV